MAQNELIQEVLSKATDRRRMLKRLVTAGAALGTVAATGLEAQTAGPTAVDVLQFALNLEYLEAEFYSIATTGLTLTQRGIPVTGSGTAGATTSIFLNSSSTTSAPIPSVAFSAGAYYSALNIAQDEINHVVLLRTALAGAGVTPVAKPAINLDALYSMGIPASLGNQSSFLALARIFEDIGVSAYGGGAAILGGTPYLTTAARILAVEGEHVGNIRHQIAQLGVQAPSLSVFNDFADVPVANSITANPSTSPTAPSAANYFAPINPFASGALFSTSSNYGLTAVRTPAQVLYLAYGAANATKGGFFPNGMNGNINTSGSPAPATALTALV